MPRIILPVRRYDFDPSTTLALDPSRTALLLVDVDGEHGEERRAVIRNAIAPALEAARQMGLRVLYTHESAAGTGGPADVTRDLIPPAELAPPGPAHWKPKQPTYDPSVAPRPDEPELPKSSQNGFDGTRTDYYLKTRNVDTIIAVGFWLKCCLFLTCLGARWHNYRVILLRNCTCPPGLIEYPDTLDPDNAEGGWMRFVFVRMFETLVGYTSTSEQLIAACHDAVPDARGEAD